VLLQLTLYPTLSLSSTKKVFGDVAAAHFQSNARSSFLPHLQEEPAVMNLDDIQLYYTA